MRRLLVVVAILGSIVTGPSSAQEVALPTGARIWVGRHAEIAAFLQSAPIERMEKVGEGVTNPDRAYFAPGGVAESALVKVLPPRRQKGYWESYKSEIAAYQLDRLLGLDMVPVTVERRVGGDLASVQLWLPDTRLLRDAGEAIPSRPRHWAKQVCRQRIFDALSANIDRNAGNILVDEEWNLILIDHSRAFAQNELPFVDDIIQTDRQLFAALKALDEAGLNAHLEPWLFGKRSIQDLLKRRDKIVERLEKLIQERGEAAVFPFDIS